MTGPEAQAYAEDLDAFARRRMAEEGLSLNEGHLAEAQAFNTLDALTGDYTPANARPKTSALRLSFWSAQLKLWRSAQMPGLTRLIVAKIQEARRGL